MIKFDDTFYDLEREIDEHLKIKYFENPGSKSLWKWAINVPLLDSRFYNLIAASDEMIEYILKGKFDKKSVLDLGCGFCSYWPLLEKYGFNEFVGCDLFSMRGQGDQGYMKAAKDFSAKFCQKSITKIYESDARDIDYHLDFNKKFDLIFTKSTNYKKLGSTGIPEDVFNEIAKKRLAPNGIAIYAG